MRASRTEPPKGKEYKERVKGKAENGEKYEEKQNEIIRGRRKLSVDKERKKHYKKVHRRIYILRVKEK